MGITKATKQHGKTNIPVVITIFYDISACKLVLGLNIKQGALQYYN